MSFTIAEALNVAGDEQDISVAGLIGTVAVSLAFMSGFAYCLRKRHERLLAWRRMRKHDKMQRMSIR